MSNNHDHNLSPEEIQLVLKVACCHIAADGKVGQEELAALSDVLRRNDIFYEPTTLQDYVVGLCRGVHAQGAGHFAESLKQEVLESRPEVGRLIKAIQDACVVPSNVPQSHAIPEASPAIHPSEDPSSSGKHNHDSSVEPEDIGRFLSPPKAFPPSPQPSGEQPDSGCAKVFVVAAIIVFVAIVMTGMWVGDPKPALLFGWLACGVAGYQIGKQKEAALTGLVWGLALGPIGVLISSQFDSRQFCATCGTRLNGRPSICPGCRSRLNGKENTSLDTGIDNPRKDTKLQGPACPHCGGILPFDAAAKEHHICMHCRCDLFWVDGVAFATSEDAETRRNEQARQQEAQAREQAAEAVAMLTRVAAEKAAAEARIATEAAVRQAQLEAELVRLRDARQAVSSAFVSVGIVSAVTECTLHTSVGPLVFRLCRDWSERWALWFATALNTDHFVNAEIFQIAPRHDVTVTRGWFGRTTRKGARIGSVIRFRPTSEIAPPGTNVMLDLIAPSLSPTMIHEQSRAHEWKLWVESNEPTSTVMITNDPEPRANATQQQGGWIGFLDMDASWGALVKLEATPVDHDNQDRPVQAVTISRAAFRSLADDSNALSIDKSNDAWDAATFMLSYELCIQACALVAATDGKLSPNELATVVRSVVWAGRRPEEIKRAFSRSCRRAYAEGSDQWISHISENLRLDLRLSNPRKRGIGAGMTSAELVQLLRKLAASAPADSARKAGLVARIKQVLAAT